jgi:phosphoadenosine phosphosulfate reductase
MLPTKEIIVSFSCGKDSIACLDVCARQFQRIAAFFMYWVKDLAFQEATLTAAERRYGIKIERVPHFALADVLSTNEMADFHPNTPEFRTITMRQVQDSWRRKTGLQWIATGEKKNDSFTRRFMLKAAGEWDQKRGVYCPLMNWTNAQVFSYLRMRHIQLPAEYTYMKGSWGGFHGKELQSVKRYFPADYRKILEVFPHCEALVRSYELFREGQLHRKPRSRKQAPELHPAPTEPGKSGGGTV